MSSFTRRLAAFGARLRFFVPAVALTAAAAFIEHPAVLVLLLAAQPLYLAGAVSALGYLLESDFAALALRRGAPFLLLLAGYAALVAVVLGLPTVQLAQGASPFNAMLVSAGFALAVATLWRLWPAFGLVFLWDDAYPEDARGSWIAVAVQRALVFARHLARERDPFFARGLPVALALLLVTAGAMSLAGLCGLLPSELRLSAHWLYALVLCPLAHLLIAQRCERLLLEDAGEHGEDEATTHEAQPLPPVPSDPDARNAQLLAVAAAGQTDAALALLEGGASPDAMPGLEARDQRSLAIIAATASDLRLLRALIGKGANINVAVGGLTPLLAATRDSYQGRPDAVMTLVANGADPRLADGEGNSALHYAALSREATVAAILLDAGAEPNAVNREGLTPLGIAAGAGNETLVRFLLEHGAKPDAPRALPALIAAAQGAEDLPGLAKLLVKHRAALDARDRLGRTALHAAALHGHAEVLDALLAAGADIDARDSHGVTALMEAARGGCNRVLQRLVFRKPDPNPTDAGGRTALVIACQSRQSTDDTVRLLLALGADTTVATRDGKRALDYALAAGRWTLARLIDPECALPQAFAHEAESEPGTPPPDRAELLRNALRHDRLEVADQLLTLTGDVDGSELVAAFPAAAAQRSPAGAQLLLAHGLDPDGRDAQGVPLALLLAAQRPLPWTGFEVLLQTTWIPVAPGLLAKLFEGTASEDLPAVERLVLRLLERGADPWARDSRGRGLLHLAVIGGREGLCQRLLALGLDPNAADARGRTPLHDAVSRQEAQAVLLAGRLLAAGADPERAAADGQTPLGAALAAGRTELARWLSWTHGFRHPGRALLPSDLPAAAAMGDGAAVERLLALGLAIDARDAQGCTALLRACGSGHTELVSELLRRGADAQLAASTGATCLSAAVSARREVVVALLLDHGVPPDQPLPGGSTPLMIAAALGATSVVELLLKRNAHADRLDERGNGALHAACQFVFQSGDAERCRTLLKRLLAAGAPVDTPNEAGQTPLLLLLGARVEASAPAPQRALAELMELLLAQGADVDAQDQRGVSCLHAAAMHGRLDACERLLRAGADVQRRDRLGRTAHEIALMLGYADVAAALKRAPAPARV